MRIGILPSLLAADVGHLAEGAALAEAAGGDALHIDIMDAHFVPNLSMGPSVVAMAKRTVKIPLSVHLMMTHPHAYLRTFAEAGADSLLIHVESESDIRACLEAIREQGVRPGITLNPETPAERAFPFLPFIDEALCMTVRPGYGGQTFMAETLPKLRAIRDRAVATGRTELELMVDGGIDRHTAPRCAAMGANLFVAGTSLYQAGNMSAEIRRIREAAASALVL